MIKELATGQHETGSDAQRVGDFYKSFMDSDQANTLGNEPLKAELSAIDAIEDVDGLVKHMAYLMTIGIDGPLGMYVSQDAKKSTVYAVHLIQSGTTMPDRDYYLKHDRKTLENQIKFLDFYILPLAKNLGVMGVFEESVGGMFTKCVKSNLARWIEEGARATDLMIKEEQEERGGNSLAKQVETLGINAPSAEDNIPSLMSSSNSCSASSKACIVCGESTGRFRCPVCAAIYCCAKCCREHKASSDCRPR